MVFSGGSVFFRSDTLWDILYTLALFPEYRFKKKDVRSDMAHIIKKSYDTVKHAYNVLCAMGFVSEEASTDLIAGDKVIRMETFKFAVTIKGEQLLSAVGALYACLREIGFHIGVGTMNKECIFFFRSPVDFDIIVAMYKAQFRITDEHLAKQRWVRPSEIQQMTGYAEKTIERGTLEYLVDKGILERTNSVQFTIPEMEKLNSYKRDKKSYRLTEKGIRLARILQVIYDLIGREYHEVVKRE